MPDDARVAAKRRRNEARRRLRARAVPEPPGTLVWFHAVTAGLLLLAAAPLAVAATSGPVVEPGWLAFGGGAAVACLVLAVPVSVLPTAPARYARARGGRLVASTTHGRRELSLDRLERVRGFEMLSSWGPLRYLLLRDADGRRVLLTENNFGWHRESFPRDVEAAVVAVDDETPQRVSRAARRLFDLRPPRRLPGTQAFVIALLSPLLPGAVAVLAVAGYAWAFTALGGRVA